MLEGLCALHYLSQVQTLVQGFQRRVKHGRLLTAPSWTEKTTAGTYAPRPSCERLQPNSSQSSGSFLGKTIRTYAARGESPYAPPSPPPQCLSPKYTPASCSRMSMTHYTLLQSCTHTHNGFDWTRAVNSDIRSQNT